MPGFKEDTIMHTMSRLQLQDAFEKASYDGHGFLVTTTETEPSIGGVIVHELSFRIRRDCIEDDLRDMHKRFGRLYLKDSFDLSRPFDDQYKSGLDKPETKDISQELALAKETVESEAAEVNARAHQPKWKQLLGLTPKPDCHF